MKPITRISLSTLLGLILPLGNIWGPFIVQLPPDSKEATFRRRLVMAEILLTCLFFITAITVMVKSISGAFDVALFKKALYVLILESAGIIVIASLAPQLYKSNKNGSPNR